jgi:GTPase
MQELQKVCGYVAIIGRPNVGKSTLMNQLLKRKMTITSKRPQTTRHSITCILTDEQQALQMVLVDTPGINFNTQHHVMKWMHQQAVSALKHLDLRVWIIEAGHWEEHDQIICEMLVPLAEKTIVIINKIDKVKDKLKILEHMQTLSDMGFRKIIPLSATKEQNFSVLFKMAREVLPISDYYYPIEQQATCTKEFMAAEVVREKLMRYLGQEIPYECTVMIDNFEIDPSNSLHKIQATIYAGNDRHKKVIVGTEGQQLKAIGQAARLTLEGMFKQKVFLKLWVKVKDSWAAHKEAITQFGLEE